MIKFTISVGTHNFVVDVTKDIENNDNILVVNADVDEFLEQIENRVIQTHCYYEKSAYNSIIELLEKNDYEATFAIDTNNQRVVIEDVKMTISGDLQYLSEPKTAFNIHFPQCFVLGGNSSTCPVDNAGNTDIKTVINTYGRNHITFNRI